MSLQSDLSRGQSAGDPHQVQRLEGNQNEADVGRQVLGALRVHEVMRGVAAGVFFEAHGRSQVDPGNQQGCFRNLLENTDIYREKRLEVEKRSCFGSELKDVEPAVSIWLRRLLNGPLRDLQSRT